jgi:hypothetical protein
MGYHRPPGSSSAAELRFRAHPEGMIACTLETGKARIAALPLIALKAAFTQLS